MLSGLFYLVGAILLAAAGLGVLWLVENAPYRDSLKAVDDFDRARRALRRRHRPGIWRSAAGPAASTNKMTKTEGKEAPSTVKILR